MKILFEQGQVYMKLKRVQQETKGIPVMTPEQGEKIYNFILDNKFKSVLELGFYHGVSTCYIAAALEKLGAGRMVAVDNRIAEGLTPSADILLSRLGLRNLVELHYEQRSYTWFLLRHMEKHQTPSFDFCYIDGAHTWDTDGFAFLLVAKCLIAGGWILFDDLDWSFAASPTLKDPAFLRDVLHDPEFLIRIPQEEQETKQVRKVWDLLATQHPDFDYFSEEGSWGFARKAKTEGTRRTLVISKREAFSKRAVRFCKRVSRSLGAGRK
jgi:predicted O-methyltransferase YrrM